MFLDYFGEVNSLKNCGKCDNCVRRKEGEGGEELSREMAILVHTVRMINAKTGINFGQTMIVKTLLGSAASKVRFSSPFARVAGSSSFSVVCSLPLSFSFFVFFFHPLLNL